MTRHVFIDCGAHQGESVVKFRRYFPEAKTYEIHSFEPNPQFEHDFDAFDGVVLHRAAVWIEDGTASLYGFDEPNRTEGYTLVDEKNDISHNQPLDVDCIDLSRWIARMFDKGDHIILKLDVEGAEYKILEKMMKDGTIDYIDELYVEFHIQWMDIDPSVHKETIRKLRSLGLTPKDWDAIDCDFRPGHPFKSHVNRFISTNLTRARRLLSLFLA